MPGTVTARPSSGRRKAGTPTASLPPPAGPRTPVAGGFPTVSRTAWPGAARRLVRTPLPLVLWLELLVGGVLVAVARRDATVVAVGFAVAATLAIGWGRRRGVPLYRLLATRWRWTVRTRAAARTARYRRAAGDTTPGGVMSLLPQLHLTSAPLRAERRFGVCFDGTGWVAVLEVEPAAAMLVPATWPVAVPLDLLAGLLAIDDIRLASVQVLVRTVPAPVDSPADSPAVRSYRRIRPVGVAALRQTWIALRLDPQAGQDAIGARGGGVDGAHRSLKRVAGRALELLEAAGVRARALDEAGLSEVLAVTLLGGVPGVDRAVDLDEPALERWDCWQAGDGAQVTWWLADWPQGHEPVEPLLQLLQAAPAGFGVVSLTIHAQPEGGGRGGGAGGGVGGGSGTEPVLRVLVRAGAPLAGLRGLVEALESGGRAVGVQLRRLDGDHGPGVGATLPLGGGYR